LCISFLCFYLLFSLNFQFKNTYRSHILLGTYVVCTY
jgi:hypothetical protein